MELNPTVYLYVGNNRATVYTGTFENKDKKYKDYRLVKEAVDNLPTNGILKVRQAFEKDVE
jgi:hypothetical protein